MVQPITRILPTGLVLQAEDTVPHVKLAVLFTVVLASDLMWLSACQLSGFCFMSAMLVLRTRSFAVTIMLNCDSRD